jgi:hypothetical protein
VRQSISPPIAGVLYLLVGLAWAMTDEIVAIQSPGASSGAVQETLGTARWVYFSFVTLTTVGYGDITPVGSVARAFAILQAFVGQLHPVVLRGRLVSLETQQGGAPSASEDPR